MTDNQHHAWCPMKAFRHGDAPRRISDTYNLHRIAGGFDAIGKYFAAHISDGRSDNVLYDTKLECVTHQRHNERWYTFIRINPNGMSPCDAEVMLKVARQWHDYGARLPDRDHKHGGIEVIKRVTAEDQLNILRGIPSNLIMPWEAQ